MGSLIKLIYNLVYVIAGLAWIPTGPFRPNKGGG